MFVYIDLLVDENKQEIYLLLLSDESCMFETQMKVVDRNGYFLIFLRIEGKAPDKRRLTLNSICFV